MNVIEQTASSPEFWNDQEAAQKLLQRRSVLEKKIERQERFESQIADAGVLFEFAEEDEESLKELRSLMERLEHEIGTNGSDEDVWSGRELRLDSHEAVAARNDEITFYRSYLEGFPFPANNPGTYTLFGSECLDESRIGHTANDDGML